MALTKIEANPQIDFAGVQGFCIQPKCLRKCVRINKPGHTCGSQPCHDGECWPKPKEK